MPSRSQRMRRVNEAVKEVLGQEIGRGLKDPRVGFVTVTGVDTSGDLSHAKVYVSIFGKGAQKEMTLQALRAAEGYLQSVIAHELRMKRTPTLEFVYDHSIDEGMKIHAMLRDQEKALGVDLSEPVSAAETSLADEPVSGDGSPDDVEDRR